MIGVGGYVWCDYDIGILFYGLVFSFRVNIFLLILFKCYCYGLGELLKFVIYVENIRCDVIYFLWYCLNVFVVRYY